MKQEFPNLNYIYKFKTFTGIQNWTRNFLLGTKICYIILLAIFWVFSLQSPNMDQIFWWILFASCNAWQKFVLFLLSFICPVFESLKNSAIICLSVKILDFTISCSVLLWKNGTLSLSLCIPTILLLLKMSMLNNSCVQEQRRSQGHRKLQAHLQPMSNCDN